LIDHPMDADRRPPRRRRFRFGLRTLFFLVTLVAVWMGWSFNWIRQRREFVRPGNELGAVVSTGSVRAPGLLWLFGEQGAQVVLLFTDNESDFERARRLFPEAHVETNPVHEVGRWITP
jgi:hypothetical protein